MSNVVTFEGGFPFEETSFTVSASGHDSFGEIEEVTLFANGLAMGTDSSAPYEFLWGAGAHEDTMICISWLLIIRVTEMSRVF